MSNARLIIDSPSRAAREFNLSGGASLGRADNNSVCLDVDGVSRYHAIIEERADGFWLNDLGSTNGTAINGRRISGEHRLVSGDVILLGGSTRVQFHSDPPAGLLNQPRRGWTKSLHLAQVGKTAKGLKTSNDARSHLSFLPFVIAGAVILILAGVVLAAYLRAGCGDVKIVGIEAGAVIQKPITVELKIERPERVKRVIYEIDGLSIEPEQFYPFAVSLDPTQLNRKVGDAAQHVLLTKVETKFGLSPAPVRVIFSFGCLPPATNELAAKMRSLAEKIGQSRMPEFEPEFVETVGRRICEYQSLAEQPLPETDEIRRAFNERGLSGALGVTIARMQRAAFAEAQSSESIGYWRIPKKDLLALNHIGSAETDEQLNQPGRAAELAALYAMELKRLLPGGETIYLVACFGSTLEEAHRIGDSLDQTRSFWQTRETLPPQAVERVIRFFAIGAETSEL